MNKTLWRFDFKLLSLFVIIFLSVGCTTIPTGRYDTLANSSQEILNATSETHVRIEKLQRRFTVETAPSKIELTKNPFITEIEGNSFDITPELRYREEALQVLVKYSLVLQAFAKRDFQGEVDKAAIELAGSVKSLASTVDSDNTEAQELSGVLATVVDVIGRAIVEKKRQEALKEVMDLVQLHIENLNKLIARDNEKIKTFVDQMLQRILSHRESQRPPYGTQERTNFDQDAFLIISEANAIKESLDGINVAINQVPQAHAETRKKLDDKSQGFDAMTELVKEVQRIDKFYRSLK